MTPDQAYDNRAAVENSEFLISDWETAAQNFRASQKYTTQIDQSYGTHQRETYDYFHALTPPKGLVIYIHGGWWRAFNKDLFTHYISAFAAQGYDAAVVNYPLVNSASIPEITQSITKAIEKLARNFDGNIYLVGHSAGGHLTARQVCTDTQLSDATVDKIMSATLVSGIYDLNPLMKLEMNFDFKIDTKIAKSESPITASALDKPINIWVGANELPTFIQQSKHLAKAWPKARYFEQKDTNHFTIIDELLDPNSALIQSTLNNF